jgi:hypothetical protein
MVFNRICLGCHVCFWGQTWLAIWQGRRQCEWGLRFYSKDSQERPNRIVKGEPHAAITIKDVCPVFWHSGKYT